MDLSARLRALMLRPNPAPSEVEALALELWAWQVDRNPAYAAFCAGLQPQRWWQIPAVPVALFRDLDLTCFPLDEARLTFRTSGTTGARGRHHLRDSALYDLGARLWAERVLGPLPPQGLALVSYAPDSSLGHMCRSFLPEMPTFFDPQRGLDREGAWRALRGARQPLFVPGTGFAFAELVAGVEEPCALPPGSMLMVTGGFKGRVLEVDEASLLGHLERLFPGARLVGEYGMTELSSQLWAPRLGGPFLPPPWMKVWAVDPWSGERVPEGLLRFLDLANHESVLCIETRDLGRILPDGRVQLRGRLAGAEPRGCSLSMEEALLGLAGQPSTPAAPARAAALAPDEGRIAAVGAALKRLADQEPQAWSEGLSAEGARAGLEAALMGISEDGLRASLAEAGALPADVTVVVARGVYTAPLEWAALYAAAGIPLRLKAPSGAESFCEAVAAAFSAEGLAVSAFRGHELGRPAAVVAMGSDETVAQIAQALPESRVVGFGHRFSVGLLGARGWSLEAVLDDICLYDGRGCMAPVVWLCLGPAPVDALARGLAERQRRWPRGEVDPALGPEWRRRVGLARAWGRVEEGPDWAVLCCRDWSPLSLPRLASLRPVASQEEVVELLRPWTGSLSTLAVGGVGVGEPLRQLFPRVVGVGEAQRPRLPRLHDGQSMLGCVCGPESP